MSSDSSDKKEIVESNVYEKEFNEKMIAFIEAFIHKQDFRAIETPLQKDSQYKTNLKRKLESIYNYQNLYLDIINAIKIINIYLDESKDQVEKLAIKNELSNSFDHFNKIRNQYSLDSNWVNLLESNTKPWSLFGISQKTLIFLYNIARELFAQKEIADTIHLLKFLLLFAPTVPSYWNALGYCFEISKKNELALEFYLISLQFNPHSIETRIYLTKCYLKQNECILAQEQTGYINKLLNSSTHLQEYWGPTLKKLNFQINLLSRDKK